VSNRTTGTILITASACVFLYGVYVVAGTGWTCFVGGFFLYVAGFNLRNRRDAPTELTAAREDHAEAVKRASTSITEARSRRGMN
jgi:hypothetical protein